MKTITIPIEVEVYWTDDPFKVHEKAVKHVKQAIEKYNDFLNTQNNRPVFLKELKS